MNLPGAAARPRSWQRISPSGYPLGDMCPWGMIPTLPVLMLRGVMKSVSKPETGTKGRRDGSPAASSEDGPIDDPHPAALGSVSPNFREAPVGRHVVNSAVPQRR